MAFQGYFDKMLSIVIPCYNEALIIADTHRLVSVEVAKITDSYEIILADDGSTDGTLAILEELAASDSHVRIIAYQPNRGAGYAQRQLYDSARGTRVILLEADLAMHPGECIPAFLSALEECDVVVGSRYCGVDPDYPIYKRFLSRTLSWINRRLFKLDLHDTQAGFVGYRKEVLDALELESCRWEIFVELFAKATVKGFELRELPLKFVHRTESGETNMIVEGPRLLWQTLKIWRQLRAEGAL
jgi:glycosyltransferase involved in cell wall biosynthesis